MKKLLDDVIKLIVNDPHIHRQDVFYNFISPLLNSDYTLKYKSNQLTLTENKIFGKSHIIDTKIVNEKPKRIFSYRIKGYFIDNAKGLYKTEEIDLVDFLIDNNCFDDINNTKYKLLQYKLKKI